MSTGQWFSDQDLVCPCAKCGPMKLQPSFDIMSLLDILCNRLGRKLPVTSCVRCAAHNIEIGGSPHSEHITGKAVDILCTDAEERHLLLTEALAYGDVTIELCPKHLHFDFRDTAIVILGEDR